MARRAILSLLGLAVAVPAAALAVSRTARDELSSLSHGRGTLGFSHKIGQLIEKFYNLPGTANDRTIIYGDLTGDAKADFQIELVGIKHLLASDFVL